MTDRTGSAESEGARGREYGGDPPAGLPRWMKIAGLVALLLALVVAVALIVGGGEHGPSRHTSSGLPGIDPAPTAVMDDLPVRSRL